MKLEGSLDAFSLPDIFQLLSYTKKTGGLRLQHAGTHGVVHFVDGAVTGASAEGGRQALARRLVGLGLVDDAAVSAAVDEVVASGSSSHGGGLVAALIRSGALSAETVAPVAYDQLHDAVFELLRWTGGDFQLAVEQTNPDDVGLRLAPDEVVARASEQRTRWGAAAAVIPSPESVPTLLGSAEPETSVRSTDWPILRLVDGRRRVSDIVDLLGAGQLGTVVTLADLVERGLIAVRPADAPDPVADIVRRFALLLPAEDGTAPEVADLPVSVESTGIPAPAEVTAAVVEALNAQSDEETEPPQQAAAIASTVVTVAEPAVQGDAEPFAGPTASAPRLGGAHQPGDVVPPRAEPFLATRQPDFAESVGPNLRSAPTSPPATSAPRLVGGGGGGSVGNTAIAMAPASDSLIERDPSVNRSLLLRLIAGVRGL